MLRHPTLDLSGVEVDVSPARMADDQLHRSLAKLGALDSLLDPAVEVGEQPREEVGLGRDRQLRMSVQHQPQERGARAGDANHERRRHTTGFAPTATESDSRPANAPPANAVEQSHGRPLLFHVWWTG